MSIILSSYYTGVGTSYGLDCTGAETGLNNPMVCSLFGSCHSHTLNQTRINVSLELDSSGVPTTHYIGGMTYSIKLTGINTTRDSLPFFGFQVTSIIGDTQAVSPTNAGTWQSPFPTGTHYCPPQPGSFVLGLMEQNIAPPPISGNGDSGSVYQIAINWIAPPAGTGTISFWGVLNAINNDFNYTGDNYNNNHIAIYEWSPAVGIENQISQEKLNFSCFPNPASDFINLMYELDEKSNVIINIYDLNGKKIMNVQNEIVNAGQHRVKANVSNLGKGTYLVSADLGGKVVVKKLVCN